MQKQPTQYNNSNIPSDNNLVWATASTVLCCPPTGIYAIIKTSEIDTKWKNGDCEEVQANLQEMLKTGVLQVL